jgi:hypothetical protein
VRAYHEPPVPLSRVLAFSVLALSFLVAVIGLAETLRHPLPEGLPPDVAEDEGGDPRDALECPEPEPREGVERDGAAVGDAVFEVLSNNLYDCPETFNGRKVRYTGEVVGAVLQRGDGAWVQLNDDLYAGDLGPLPAHRDFRGGNAGVGVFIPDSAVAGITWVGGHAAQGDVLEVVGVFHRVDPQAHEVAIIRAEEVEVVREGGPFEHPVLRDRQVAAVITGLLALGFLVAQVRRSRRFRRVAGLEPL